MVTREEVFTELKQVFDPEIPVNIVDLGLVYEIEVEGTKCSVKMSLTSKSCPEAQNIPVMVERRCNGMSGIDETNVEIVWEPTWGPTMISADGRELLGIEDE
ncbi:MAG: metal-sulfur cluster biosynthetic enzyme [Planctomycetota bacterium]|jgi:metal-sulfur cluster biosynthetic enzyme